MNTYSSGSYVDNDWLDELAWLTAQNEIDHDMDNYGDNGDNEEDEENEWTTVTSAETSSSPSSTSPCCHDVPESKPKRKRIRTHRKRKSTVLIPRLFKRDIRRHYATMLANVTNSHDLNLYFAFFRTYSINNLVFKRLGHDPSVNSFRPTTDTMSIKQSTAEYRTSDIHGFLPFINAIYLTTRVHPDQVLKVRDIQIFTRSDSADSKITFHSTIDFTLLYEIHPVYFMDSIFEAINEVSRQTSQESKIEIAENNSTASDASLETEGNISEARANKCPTMTLSSPVIFPTSKHNFIDPFDFYEKQHGTRMPLLNNPIPITLNIQMTLHINEERKISMLEADHISLSQ